MRTHGLLALGALFLGWGLMGAASPAGEPVAGGEAILGPQSFLRGWMAYRTPVQLGADGAIKPSADPQSKEGKPIGDYQSPLPAADWIKPEYDDSGWARYRGAVEAERGRATGGSHAGRHVATANSAILLRGKFLVEDPARAKDLKLTVEYVGGLAVYVNGQEVARAHLPAGELKPDTLAEKYPDDLHCGAGGMYLVDPAKNQAGFERRYRRLADVVVPARLLRKGTNVLALDIRRAPLNEAAVNAKRLPGGGMSTVMGMWAYAGLKSLTLSGPPGSGVTPSTGRPAGAQVWNAAPFQTVSSADYGDAGELRPVLIHAARNSVFSGRLVVSSGQPIKGLKATVADLASADGAKLPASAVRVRYAEPAVAGRSWRTVYRAPYSLFDGLLDAIPAEVPVLQGSAMAPLWFTVRVPKDAKAGRYEGQVTVQADGLPATTVPLVVTVHDWAMPEPKDFRLKSLAFTSQHEAMARHYGIPLWSDRHFEMLGESMALMAEAGSRQVLVNLAISWYGGSNDESMIRWVKQADGSFKPDFTVFDKYLAVIEKRLGKPHPLRLNCWGQMKVDATTKAVAWYGPRAVSLVDGGEAGKVASLDMPPPDKSEEFVAFWKPALDEARKKIEARGWFDVTCLGHNAYCDPPTPQVVSLARKIWPDSAWGITGHAVGLGQLKASEAGASMPCRYSEVVWTEGHLRPRQWQSLIGPPRKDLWCSNARDRHKDYSPLTVYRDLPEEMALRGHSGVGQLGVDNFPIRKPNGGFYALGNDRGGTGPQCSTQAILAAGPSGPVASERFEMFREGVELCEAIVFLEEALKSGKVGGELARKINRCLDERSECFIRGYSGSPHQDAKPWSAGRLERDTLLLSLCAEAAGAGGAKP